jgi:hypothetical protein
MSLSGVIGITVETEDSEDSRPVEVMIDVETIATLMTAHHQYITAATICLGNITKTESSNQCTQVFVIVGTTRWQARQPVREVDEMSFHRLLVGLGKCFRHLGPLDHRLKTRTMAD